MEQNYLYGYEFSNFMSQKLLKCHETQQLISKVIYKFFHMTGVDKGSEF